MNLTQEQLTRLAKLTALNADSHIDIASVLSSVDAIKNADTTGVSAIARSGNISLNPRKDIIVEDASLPSKLLECSPQKIAAHQIVLAGIMHGD